MMNNKGQNYSLKFKLKVLHAIYEYSVAEAEQIHHYGLDSLHNFAYMPTCITQSKITQCAPSEWY